MATQTGSTRAGATDKHADAGRPSSKSDSSKGAGAKGGSSDKSAAGGKGSSKKK